MIDQKDKFEVWGLLELFGHQRLAGQIAEQSIGGILFIRIDVPAIDDLPAYTRFFSGGAIYGMTPTSEEVARALAARLRAKPVQPYALELPGEAKRLASTHEDDDDPHSDEEVSP